MPPKKGNKAKKGGGKAKKQNNTKNRAESKSSDLSKLSYGFDSLGTKSVISSAHLSTKSIGLRKLPELITKSNKKVSFKDNSKSSIQNSISSYKTSVSEKLSSSFLAEIFGENNETSPTNTENESSSTLKQKSALEGEENVNENVDLNQQTINLNEQLPEKSELKLKLELIQNSTNICDVSDHLVKNLIYHLSAERWGPALKACKQLVFLQPLNEKFLDFYQLLNSLIKNKKIIKKYKIKPIKRYLPGAQPENQDAAKKEGKKANQQYTYKSRARKNKQTEPLDEQAGIPVGTPGVPVNLPVPPNRPNEQLKQFVHVDSTGVVEKTYEEINLKSSSKPKKLLSNRQNSRNSMNSSLSKHDSIRDEIEFKLSVKLIQHSTKINE